MKLAADDTSVHDRSSSLLSASLRPDSPKKVLSPRHHFPFGCDSDGGGRHDFAVPGRSPDNRFRPSDPRQAARPSVTARGIASDPAPAPPLRFREQLRRSATWCPSRPESADRLRQHRTTCHDHNVWSERQALHQRATTGSARRQLAGRSQQEPKTPSRGSMPFDEIRCADR